MHRPDKLNEDSKHGMSGERPRVGKCCLDHFASRCAASHLPSKPWALHFWVIRKVLLLLPRLHCQLDGWNHPTPPQSENIGSSGLHCARQRYVPTCLVRQRPRQQEMRVLLKKLASDRLADCLSRWLNGLNGLPRTSNYASESDRRFCDDCPQPIK